MFFFNRFRQVFAMSSRRRWKSFSRRFRRAKIWTRRGRRPSTRWSHAWTTPYPSFSSPSNGWKPSSPQFNNFVCLFVFFYIIYIYIYFNRCNLSLYILLLKGMQQIQFWNSFVSLYIVQIFVIFLLSNNNKLLYYHVFKNHLFVD